MIGAPRAPPPRSASSRFTASRPWRKCETIRATLAALCAAAGTKGTLLIAPEGINGTIAGADAAVDRVLDSIRALPACADLQTSEARADRPPFDRMKVRVRREIVTMRETGVDPRAARRPLRRAGGLERVDRARGRDPDRRAQRL